MSVALQRGMNRERLSIVAAIVSLTVTLLSHSLVFHRNKLTIIAEPLEKGLAEDIENGKLNIKMPPRELGKHLQEVSELFSSMLGTISQSLRVWRS